MFSHSFFFYRIKIASANNQTRKKIQLIKAVICFRFSYWREKIQTNRKYVPIVAMYNGNIFICFCIKKKRVKRHLIKQNFKYFNLKHLLDFVFINFSQNSKLGDNFYCILEPYNEFYSN